MPEADNIVSLIARGDPIWDVVAAYLDLKRRAAADPMARAELARFEAMVREPGECPPCDNAQAAAFAVWARRFLE